MVNATSANLWKKALPITHLAIAALLSGCCAELDSGRITGRPIRAITNSIGMVFKRIPAGVGLVGSSEGDPWREGYAMARYGCLPKNRGRYANLPDHWEGRQAVAWNHVVWFGETEVTNEQFRLFRPGHGMRAEPYCVDPNLGNVDYNINTRMLAKLGVARIAGDKYPANNVTRRDANAFCAWLSNLPAEKAAGRRYRLPTEDEWEVVCRAGSKAIFSWGDDPNDACQYANLADASGRGLWICRYPVSCNDGFMGPSPCAALRPNAYGVFDMIGNVWELCLGGVYTRHGERGYLSDGVTGRAAVPVRGGSWGSGFTEARCSARLPVSISTRSPLVGFRVVLIQTEGKKMFCGCL